MKFSVLMSVYKNDNSLYFEEALKSVTNLQTLRPNQVVIVKDGPVDKTIDFIINKIKKNNSNIEFTVLTKSKNEGLAAALNDGIKLCKYDLIARMDSDDISLNDRFEKQINLFKKYNDVDAIGGSIAEFNKRPGDIQSKREVGLTMDEIVKMAKKRIPMNHVSVMYKKKSIIEVGCYSENFGKLEDYKLWVDLINANRKLMNISDIIVNVRVGDGFLSRRSNKREIQDWDMLQKYLLKNNIVNHFEAFLNKIYIRVFIYMPGWLKKIAYSTILKRK